MLWQKAIGSKGGGAAGIEYVGSYVQGFAGTISSLTITFGGNLTGGIASSASEGDLVIVYFGTGSAAEGSADRDLVVAGYTEVAELYSTDTAKTNLVVAYKFMGSTPDTTFVLTAGTRSAEEAGAVAVQVWRGIDQTTPMDVTPTTATGSNSRRANPPAITPTTPGAFVVAGGAGAFITSFTLPNLFSSSDLSDFRSENGFDSGDVTIGLGYAEWTSGSFNPAAFTTSSDSTSNSWAAVTLALRPA